MYTRQLKPSRGAFFLFGPRGTGKTTWIRNTLSGTHHFNLLQPEKALLYEREPEAFRAEVLTCPKSDWIVIDEVQRVPRLLDEVHHLIEDRGYRKFALTGSSARKLRRGSANLLAGRAVMRSMFPLTAAEMEFDVPVAQRLRFGSMPMSVVAEDDAQRVEYLRTFVTTYLAEEVRAEGLVRDLGAFGRFLDVAALAGGQKTNLAGLARDARISRDTIRGYFEILVDTLLGSWLPAWRPRAKVKEVALPKFYWFDAGVLHAAAGGFEQPLASDWDGVLLEHLVLHELRAHMHYNDVRGTLGYWGIPSGGEVDFVWWYGRQMVAIEVKAGNRFKREFTSGLRALQDGIKGRVRSFVIYRGQAELVVDGIRVLPVETFLRRLHEGAIIG